MEKPIIITETNKDARIYSNHFTCKGMFSVDKIEIVPNNPITDQRLVAVIHATNIETGMKVSATSDKFTDQPHS